MFQFKRDFEQAFRAARSVDVARGLNPSLQTFDVLCWRAKARIPRG